jgi:hypothetical protein
MERNTNCLCCLRTIGSEGSKPVLFDSLITATKTPVKSSSVPRQVRKGFDPLSIWEKISLILA